MSVFGRVYASLSNFNYGLVTDFRSLSLLLSVVLFPPLKTMDQALALSDSLDILSTTS